jgi:lycopene cyclase domain-containing protein
MPDNSDLLDEEDKKKETATARKKWPASVILAAPFFLLVIPLYKAARERVNWKAAIAMIFTFEALMFCAEIFSVSRGHWVWNPNRTLGPTVFGVPIEEPLLYYWFPPLFVVLMAHAFEGFFEKRGKGK